MTWKCHREVLTLTMTSIQRLLAKVREHWFPESRHHILTIALIKTMFTTWRRVLELSLQCFSYLAIKSAVLSFEYPSIFPFEFLFTGFYMKRNSKSLPFFFNLCWKMRDCTLSFVSPTYFFQQLHSTMYTPGLLRYGSLLLFLEVR